MADFDRKFLKNALLSMTEGEDGINGDLTVDQPVYKVASWMVNAVEKTLSVEVLFDAPQGSRTERYSRSFVFDLTRVPQGARTRFRDQYDWITENIIRAIDKLSDGVEQ